MEFQMIQPTTDAKATWKRLEDYGNIADWNSGILASRIISDTKSGIGMERQCDLKGKSYVRERVTEWEPKQRRLSLEFTHFPLPVRVQATFTVTDDHVQMDYWFQGKGLLRPAGPLLKPVFKKAVRGLLEDLVHVES
jgi:hypothetical protein